MNVYDFDGTIFDGDSTVRFYCYCLKRTPQIIRRWPSLIAAALHYAVKRMDKTAFKQCFFRFLLDLPDGAQMVDAFWDENMGRIKSWYLAKQRPDDVIISASPEFLLAPACRRLGIHHLIASRVDIKTGACIGKNCHGEEKVTRFREYFGDAAVEEFYSDSDSDAPMAKLAQKSYRVKGNRLTLERLQ